MKQITELTEKEILVLTDNQLQKMVQYKMAENGIKILEYPATPEYKEILPKDDIGYRVSGLTYPLIDKNAAEEIGAVLTKLANKFQNESYRNSDYSNKYLKPLEEYSLTSMGVVNQELYYKPSTLEIVAADIKSNKDIKEAYTEAVNEYNRVNDEANYIRIDIYSRYNEVVEKHRNMDRMKSTYDSYLLLADGNADIALNFLNKAYDVDYETQCFVQGREMVLETEVLPTIE